MQLAILTFIWTDEKLLQSDPKYACNWNTYCKVIMPEHVFDIVQAAIKTKQGIKYYILRFHRRRRNCYSSAKNLRLFLLQSATAICNSSHKVYLHGTLTPTKRMNTHFSNRVVCVREREGERESEWGPGIQDLTCNTGYTDYGLPIYLQEGG